MLVINIFLYSSIERQEMWVRQTKNIFFSLCFADCRDKKAFLDKKQKNLSPKAYTTNCSLKIFKNCIHLTKKNMRISNSKSKTLFVLLFSVLLAMTRVSGKNTNVLRARELQTTNTSPSPSRSPSYLPSIAPSKSPSYNPSMVPLVMVHRLHRRFIQRFSQVRIPRRHRA
jgi:hypothetical protein